MNELNITHTSGVCPDGSRWYRGELVHGDRYYQAREQVPGYIIGLLPAGADIDGESRRVVEKLLVDMVERGIGLVVAHSGCRHA